MAGKIQYFSLSCITYRVYLTIMHHKYNPSHVTLSSIQSISLYCIMYTVYLTILHHIYNTVFLTILYHRLFHYTILYLNLLYHLYCISRCSISLLCIILYTLFQGMKGGNCSISVHVSSLYSVLYHCVESVSCRCSTTQILGTLLH